MEKASQLLTTTLLSIKEIMAMVGYNNRSNFLRHFRRYYDCRTVGIQAAELHHCLAQMSVNQMTSEWSHAESEDGCAILSVTKTGFGVEPTGTLHNVPNGFAARGEHRLP